MKFFEKKMLPFFLKRSKNTGRTRKRVRLWTSILALLVLLGLVGLFLGSIIPQIYTTANDLISNINTQIAGVLDWANDITGGHFEKELMDAKTDKNIDNAIDTFVEWVQSYLNLEGDETINTLAEWGMSAGKVFINIILGIIVSVYVLVSKETFKAHVKKVIYGIFKPEHGNVVLEVARKANEIFYGFIIGKIVDSAIIGVLCYICMLIFRFPYPLLSSVIVGVTNVVPVFGPYIGAVPTTIIIFLTNPVKGIYFLIFIFVLQQIDGNIIGPKILGDSTGISAFWVVFAIVVGGGLFGFMGMLLGVPTVSLLYYIGGRISNWALRKRGLSTQSDEYTNLKFVEPSTGIIVQKTPEEIADDNPIRKTVHPKKKNSESKISSETSSEEDKNQ